VTLPFALQIANHGWEKALRLNADLAKGLNTHEGKVTYKAVAEAHGYEFSPVF
jgi:alanine dehydrogenase